MAISVTSDTPPTTGTAPSHTPVSRRARGAGMLFTFFTLLKLAGGAPTTDQLRHSYTFDMFEDTHPTDRLTTFNQQQRLDHLLASHNDSCIAVGMTGTMFSNVVTPPMSSNMVASVPMPREHMRCQRIPDNVQFDGLNESEIVAKVGLGMELG